MKATTIRQVLIEPLNIERTEPFIIAIGTKHRIENVVLTLVLENGVEGYGEAAPLEPINGENQATVLATLNSCRDFLLGQDVTQFMAIARQLKQVFWAQATARCAIEMALLDALAKSLDIPLYQFWGGAEHELETDCTISLVPAETARRQAEQLAQAGYRVLKVKIGKNVKQDIERVLAVNEGAPSCQITLDANQGYTPDQAVYCIRELERLGIRPALLEQPVTRHDWMGMRFVREHVSPPVAADETVFTGDDAIQVVRTGCADVINIKIMKSGIIEALDIAAIARRAHLGLMIGCMLESVLAMSASVHLAAGLGGFRFIDLDPHPPTASEPFTGGPRFVEPVYTLQDDAGLGVFRKA